MLSYMHLFLQILFSSVFAFDYNFIVLFYHLKRLLLDVFCRLDLDEMYSGTRCSK